MLTTWNNGNIEDIEEGIQDLDSILLQYEAYKEHEIRKQHVVTVLEAMALRLK